MKDMARERRRQIAELNDDMKVFGRLPKGYAKWVEEELFREETFLAFDNKTRTAYCTACNTEHEIPKRINYKHNSTGECPVCGKQVKFVRQNVKKFRETIKWSLVIQRHGEDLLFRYIRNIKNYSEDYRTHEVEVLESLRTIVGKHTTKDFQYTWFVEGWLPYRDEQWTFYHQPTIYDMPKDGVTIYKPKNLSRTVKNSWACYSGLPEYVNHIGEFHEASYGAEKYVCRYRTEPWREKLSKVGFFKLIDYYTRYHYDCAPIKNESTLRDTLGISKHQLKLLLHAGDPTQRELKLATTAKDMPTDLFDRIRNNANWLQNFEAILGTDIGNTNRLLSYLEAQNIPWTDYRDYMYWLTNLSYPLDKSYRYPKDFEASHDKLMDEWQKELDRREAEKNKELDAKLMNWYEELMAQKVMHKHTDDLLICMPKSVAEIKREGRELHHCVGTYAERVADGKTNIFFIRKTAEPDTPYYTLEINNHGEMVQCRGKHNALAQGEIMQFAQDFRQSFVTTMKLSA